MKKNQRLGLGITQPYANDIAPISGLLPSKELFWLGVGVKAESRAYAEAKAQLQSQMRDVRSALCSSCFLAPGSLVAILSCHRMTSHSGTIQVTDVLSIAYLGVYLQGRSHAGCSVTRGKPQQRWKEVRQELPADGLVSQLRILLLHVLQLGNPPSFPFP